MRSLFGDVGVRSLLGCGSAITVWDVGMRSLFGDVGGAIGVLGVRSLI